MLTWKASRGTCEAENLSPRTIQTYMESTRQMAEFLAGQGMPQDVANIRREHVESFIAYLLERWKPATANNRYRGLQSFFKWLEEEGEIRESPMAKMKPPRVPENPPPVLREEGLRALLATCEKGAAWRTGGTRRYCGYSSTPAGVERKSRG